MVRLNENILQNYVQKNITLYKFFQYENVPIKSIRGINRNKNK